MYSYCTTDQPLPSQNETTKPKKKKKETQALVSKLLQFLP